MQSTDVTKLHKELRFERLSLIIVDEVSNIDAKMMASIDIRLRQLAGDDKANLPFGGMGIIFFGDMGQLPPVKSKSLPYSVMQMTTMKEAGNDTSNPPPALLRPDEEQNTVPQQQPRRKRVRTDQFVHNILSIKAHHEKDKINKAVSKYGIYSPGSMDSRGAMLFRSLTRYHLDKQQRAANDHTHMTHSINLSSTSNYRQMT